MSHRAMRIVLATVLALAVADLTYAQSSQANQNPQQGKQKKKANQVPDTGTSPDLADPADGGLERVVANVPITVRSDGTIVAELDDTFMEAVTVSKVGDGSLQFSHVTGLGAAARAVTHPAPMPRTLPSRTLPALFPILEEKE